MTGSAALAKVPDTPALKVLASTASDAENAALAWSEAGIVVRYVRGRKMQSTAKLMNEVAAALQFPWYFGENWAAFDECFSELESLPPDRPIVVLIEDAAEVLADEPIIELEALVSAARSASKTFSTPIADGEWWDRPAIPFHVVLQSERDRVSEVVQRWTAAGAIVEPLSV